MKPRWSGLLIALCVLPFGCGAKSISLMPSKDIEGWETLNGGDWVLKDGVLAGSKDAAIAKHCILLSKETFGDFTCVVEYKAVNGNSGFYFRLTPSDNKVGFAGYHAEIDSKGKNAGGLFDVAVKWIVQPDPKLIAKAFKPGAWNTMTIHAAGQDIRVLLNGHEMSHIEGKRELRGKFGVQLHANENTQVQFRKIEITER